MRVPYVREPAAIARGLTTRLLAPVIIIFLTIGLALALTANGYAQSESIVHTEAVKTESLVHTVDVIGRVVARQGGVVAARVSGTVESIAPDVGSRVEKGDVIARINVDVTSLQLESAENELKRAQAALDVAKESLRLSTQDRERLEKLQATASASRATYENALQQERIDSARISEAAASVAMAESALHLAALNKTYTEVVAPYSGMVTERLTEVGSYLALGDDVVRLLNDNSLEIEVNVPFERLAGLSGSGSLEVRLDDGSVHSATLRSIIPTEDPRTRTRPVRMSVDFGASLVGLAVGQSATVRIPASQARDVLSVHKDAVIRRGNGSIVYIVDKDIAQVRQVTLGQAVGNRFEVIDGLKEGDQVVIRGNERLRPQAKVRIAGESS